ncbi:hypothetical protein HDU96_002283, partial [Phlyctochytrium bullatum]
MPQSPQQHPPHQPSLRPAYLPTTTPQTTYPTPSCVATSNTAMPGLVARATLAPDTTSVDPMTSLGPFFPTDPFEPTPNLFNFQTFAPPTRSLSTESGLDMLGGASALHDDFFPHALN